ncbi:MAG: sigma-70 family RNA polymerase sigma factor [Bradyrhizobium sp.]
MLLGAGGYDLDLDTREQQWAAWLLAGTAGDADAYRRFLDAVTPYLRSVAIRRCATLGASRSDAEDIVQDVLLAVHLKRGTWDSARPIGPWLAAIVRNKVIDAFRRRGRRIDVPIDDVINSLATPEATADPDVKLLGRLLSQLKDNQREIVTAISLEGASVRQAAERFKMSEGAVRVALHRALRSLAALYRKGEG